MLLKDKRLSADDFGGLTGYLGLLGFCRKIVNNHPKGGLPYIPLSEEP
jgi:hypothetical protein